MSLRERVARWLLARGQSKDAQASQQRSNPIAHVVLADNRLSELEHEFDLVAHSKVYLVNVYANACQRAIARDVAATPLIVERKARVDGKYEWKEEASGELYDLLHDPNRDETFNDLLKKVVYGYLGPGCSGLIYDDADRELYYVKGEWIKVKVSDDGRIESYRITKSGISYNADVDDLIFFGAANPTSDFTGLPPAEPIKKQIMMKLGLDQYLLKFFENFGQLGLTLTTDQDLDDTQIAVIKKELNRLHQGAAKSWNPAVFASGAKPNSILAPLKDLVPNLIEEKVRAETLTAYGVPPVVLGYMDGASFANSFVQRELYQQDTVHPYRIDIAATINKQFTRVRFGDDIRIAWDLTQVPGFGRDMEKLTGRATRLYAAGLITRNEGREMVGYDPDEDGDEYKSAQQFGLGGSEDLGYKAPTGTRDSGGSSRTDLWAEYDRRLTKQEVTIEKSVKRFFVGQLDRLLNKIDKMTGRGRHMHRLWVSLVARAELSDSDADGLFDLQAENAELVAEVGATMEVVAQKSGKQALKSYGISGSFDVLNPLVETMLKRHENRIKKINDTTFSEIKRILRESYENGESIEQIRKTLEETFAEFDKVRAKAIARTETNGLVNGASHEAYRQNGIKWEEWLTAPGAANPRHEALADLDGQVRRLDEPFSVDGEPLMYPGDPSGSAENVINCRCTVIPRPDLEE